ncbi:MAG: type II toxin-antitoxin system HicB family antitoxin [Candidatus Omnitrophica bacterium]|nr:type II toxin-antitoxin system HicB family antitoxin [Candidatus Omnitrophota bacterium]MBU0878038.1 type II toxin-antitoxin system HicB family antitoxin [Candidatus Omnitrophota bacterium]MBU0896171.1 type II toxin-antitoxin system HicB family antitoxin [Candidatus Omnitrophota bacterium]MBU1134769.1 type II toxin-antitoxin system HicB family antitoxin [Candidatus Omnitrophota bacterium]MBU1810957.1 type II toxin-antitoxin system HicB family antitoxin [Candidatus Omnitrophota bacterium]
MNIKVHLERDEDGMWVVTCPSLPGCISQGKSKDDALRNIKSAIKLHIKSFAQDGLPIFKTTAVQDTLVKVQV